MNEKSKNIQLPEPIKPVEKSKPSKVGPNVSRLGGGYGGTQHEQYPGEHGYEDSGDAGTLDHDDNIKVDTEHHEPNRNGYRDHNKSFGNVDEE